MSTMDGWSKDAREAAQLVIDTYGEPHEATASVLIWNGVGPWKRIVASRDPDAHDFPAPHKDSVESFLTWSVPSEKLSDINAFDGSVVVNRTRGEVSARCHDEQANHLALNLTHDIIAGVKTVEEARAYYAKEFLGFRKKEPTPYMDGLRFEPSGGPDTDERLLSDAELEAGAKEGKAKQVA